MARINEFDGNGYVDMTIETNQIDKEEMDDLFEFIAGHKEIYLFGRGLCGKGMHEYFEVCGFDKINGFVTSETFNEFLEKYKINESGLILSLKSDYYREILPMLLKTIQINDVFFLSEKTKRVFTQTFSRDYLNDNLWLSLPLALHCNINCASCNMFSPLCLPEFYLLKNVKRDIERIKSINPRFKKINITGGEPFLNPQALEILSYIRKAYPKLKIDIYSNGILLEKFSDKQFEILSQLKVEIHITEYEGFSEKLKKVYEKFDEWDIDYAVDFTDEKKLFYKKTIDFEKGTPVYDYINCQYYTFCFGIFLYDEKLYKCPMALNSEKINKYSKKSIMRTDKDYLNLQNVESINQIHDFWRSRLPMCGYCPRVTEVINWKKSERIIQEWM